MKCKVINSTKNFLERDINDWLETGKYEIFDILQTQNDLYITITIFYYNLKEIRIKKLNKLNYNDNTN